MNLNGDIAHSRLWSKVAAYRVVCGPLGEVLNRRLRLRCVPRPGRRRASCAALRMLSGSAAPASGPDGLVVPA